MVKLLISVIIVYFVLGMLLYWQQRNFIYYPVPSAQSTLKTLVFETPGAKIYVSNLNEGKQKAILYFGGNAEDVDLNAGQFREWFPEYSVYLFKYRGYGGSSGKPSEKANYEDALYVYDQLIEKYSSLSLIGRSLGSGVATYLAANRKSEKLALVTPYDSILALAQSRFPIYPMSLMLKDQYDSQSRAAEISSHTLLLAAEQDNVIPPVHAKRLADAFGDNAVYKEIKGAGHNDIALYPSYVESIVSFFNGS